MKILIIAMHHRQDYFKRLLSLMERENIDNTITIKKKGIATSLIDKKVSFLLQRGAVSSRYDKAFAAIVEDKQKAKYLLKLIENDINLGSLNLKDKGFICALPFLQRQR